ncbi:MAG: hypothetical protein R2752_15050 [Vicinamibacterales bacterium]
MIAMLTTLVLVAIAGFIAQMLRLPRATLGRIGAGHDAGAWPEAASIAELYARFDSPPPSRFPADTPVRRSPGPARQDDAAPVRHDRRVSRRPDAAPAPPDEGWRPHA